MDTIGKRIAYSRKLKNLTKRELATQLNVHESSINKYENDMVDLSLSKIKDIAKILSVTPEYLACWSDQRTITISGDNSVNVADNTGSITYNNTTVEETNPSHSNTDDVIKLQETNEVVQADMLTLLQEILKVNREILAELRSQKK